MSATARRPMPLRTFISRRTPWVVVAVFFLALDAAAQQVPAPVSGPPTSAHALVFIGCFCLFSIDLLHRLVDQFLGNGHRKLEPVQLFDIRSDPQEKHDLADRHLPKETELREWLEILNGLADY